MFDRHRFPPVLVPAIRTCVTPCSSALARRPVSPGAGFALTLIAHDAFRRWMR
jgi:hypothetical protein